MENGYGLENNTYNNYYSYLFLFEDRSDELSSSVFGRFFYFKERYNYFYIKTIVAIQRSISDWRLND